MPDSMSFPSSFTPAVREDYLKNLTAPIDEQEAADVGTARSEALKRGLDGDVWEASAVGEAKKTGNVARSKAISDFNFGLANMGEQENLAAQGHQYGMETLKAQEDFSSAESAKDRDFRERMARLGYAFDSSMYERQSGDQMSGLGMGIAGSIASNAIGGYFGSLGRKPV
jgi:hypothetical protein